MKTLVLFLGIVAAIWGDEGGKKVVFDLTTGELERFEKRLLSGIAFHKTHYESNLDELEVAVVIHGGAYKFFVKNLSETALENVESVRRSQKELAKRIASLSQNYDVEFLICQGGMRQWKIAPENLYDSVKPVASSTVGLIDKQSEGYAYVPID